MNPSGEKGRLCIVSLESKRLIDFKSVAYVADGLAAYAYYPDKISRVAFNQPEEIVRALSDCADNYENSVVICPKSMSGTVREFFAAKCGAEFDGLGILNGGKSAVFLLYSDGANRLQLEDIKAFLDKKYGVCYESTVIRCVGAPARLIDTAISNAKKFIGGDGVFFNVKENFDDFRIEIVYSSLAPKIKLDETVRELVKTLGDYVYALEDIPLAEQLFRLLKLRRMKISVAESFTGGGLGKRLVEVPGVSEVYFEGLNTYSNEAKMLRLGVSELTLNQRGAVSAETAYQMAEGLLNTGNCDVAVSTTGIAGPKSDNTSKPVGLAYIGVGVEGDIAVYKFNFAGDRQSVSERAINHALFLAYKRLK